VLVGALGLLKLVKQACSPCPVLWSGWHAQLDSSTTQQYVVCWCLNRGLAASGVLLLDCAPLVSTPGCGQELCTKPLVTPCAPSISCS